MVNFVPTLNFNKVSNSYTNKSSCVSDPCTPRNDPSRLLEEQAIVDEIMQKCSPQSSPGRGTPPRTLRRDSLDLKQLRSYKARSESRGDDTIQTQKASSSPDIKLVRQALESFEGAKSTEKVLDILKSKLIDCLLLLSGSKQNAQVRVGYLPDDSKRGFSINFVEELQKKDSFNQKSVGCFINDAQVTASLNSDVPDFDVNEFMNTFFYHWKRGNLLRLYYYDMILADLKDWTTEDCASLLLLKNYYALLNKHGMLIFKENIKDLENQTCNLDLDHKNLKKFTVIAESNFIPQRERDYFFKRFLQFTEAGFKIDESLVIFKLNTSYVFFLQKFATNYLVENSFSFIQNSIISALKLTEEHESHSLAILGSSEADYIFDHINFSNQQVEKKLVITRLKEPGCYPLKDFDEDNCYVTKSISKTFDITSFFDNDVRDWDVNIGKYFGFFSVLFTTITAELNKCFFKLNALIRLNGILIYEEIVTDDKIALAKRFLALQEETDSFFQMNSCLSNLGISKEHEAIFYLRMQKFAAAGFEVIKENIRATPSGYVVSLRKVENTFETSV